LNDSVVIPHESEDHAFWQWGSTTELTTFNTTEEYQGDWLGLQSLDVADRVDHYSYEGDHLRWSEVRLFYQMSWKFKFLKKQNSIGFFCLRSFGQAPFCRTSTRLLRKWRLPSHWP
jgi:hypothetical protein